MSKEKNAGNLFYETLIWISNHLSSSGISYMITGGSAVGFWGHIRTTMDIDIVVQIQIGQCDEILSLLEKDAYIDIVHAKQSIIDGRMFNVIHNTTLFKVDFIPLKQEIYELEKFNKRIRIDLDGKSIDVISPEDLIISKLLWSQSIGKSEKQLKDCESIYQLNRSNLDVEYLKKWLAYFNINEFMDIII